MISSSSSASPAPLRGRARPAHTHTHARTHTHIHTHTACTILPGPKYSSREIQCSRSSLKKKKSFLIFFFQSLIYVLCLFSSVLPHTCKGSEQSLRIKIKNNHPLMLTHILVRTQGLEQYNLNLKQRQ